MTCKLSIISNKRNLKKKKKTLGNKILLRGWIHIYVSIIRLLVFEYDVKTCSRFSKADM